MSSYIAAKFKGAYLKRNEAGHVWLYRCDIENNYL